MVRLTKRERTERRRTVEAEAAAELEAAATGLPPVPADDLDDEPEQDAPAAPTGGSVDLVIEAGAAPERLDAALARRIPDVSRSRLKARCWWSAK